MAGAPSRGRAPASVERALAAWLALGAAGAAAAGDAGEVARAGDRFYRLGVAASGGPVAVTVQGDLALRSTEMPCVSCHRRSGLGSFEGPVRVPPVAGRVLFAPLTVGLPQMGSVRASGAGTRPAYDEATLARALREGVDPAGRAFSPTMPRYAVEDADVAGLAAHLRTLSPGEPAGVTASSLHLATITTPTLDPGRRRSMLETLRAFVATKNANTRGEVRRRERGPWDMKSHYEGFRRWVLHEWTLRGDPRSWPDQLASYYVSQPVFALVGGAAEGDWSPVHDFCERASIPCVLPLTDLPPREVAPDAFYSIYFSQGLTLEARTLAEHLAGTRQPATTAAQAPEPRRLTQVLGCGSAAERAARELAGAVGPGFAPRARCLDAFTPAAWRTALRDAAGGPLVLWVGAGELEGLVELARLPGSLRTVGALYLSSSLLGDGGAALAGPLAEKAFLVHPFVHPDEFERHVSRTTAWLKLRGIMPQQPRVAVNALFAATLVADALAHPGTLESREYFVERIEHMIGRSPQPSAFPSLSLAATRRFASLGCYVLKLPSAGTQSFETAADWRVPEPRSPEAQESR